MASGGHHCPRCGGLGWQCEDHDQPAGHLLANGEACGGAAKPCEEPGCPDSGRLKGWHSLMHANAEADALARDVEHLATQMLETFGVEAYTQALIHANAIGKQQPNDPRAMSLALRDELKRLLGPH